LARGFPGCRGLPSSSLLVTAGAESGLSAWRYPCASRAVAAMW